MTKHFLVEVEGETISIALTLDTLLMMGQGFHASLIELQPNLYSLLLNGHSHLIHLHPESDTLLTINGHTISCNLVNDRSTLISRYGQQTGSTEVITELRAPMSGLITDILVKAGDAVTQGQELAILEAMKMENELPSPCTSIVRKIHVNRKDSVTIDTLLMEFEP